MAMYYVVLCVKDNPLSSGIAWLCHVNADSRREAVAKAESAYLVTRKTPLKLNCPYIDCGDVSSPLPVQY